MDVSVFVWKLVNSGKNVVQFMTVTDKISLRLVSTFDRGLEAFKN